MTSDHLISGRFAVVGNPIQHSLSPVIHSAFAQQSGRQIEYRAELVDLNTFEAWVTTFFQQGGRGLNVTLPFKTRAYALADEVSDRARAAGAANFLAQNAAGQILADNTDGKGMVTDMTDNAGWSLNGARVLVLGAGGAVKGVIPSLLQAAPERIVVANRTSARAEALASEWINPSTPVSGGSYELALTMPWDVIVNGTSTGLSNEMPALPTGVILAEGCCCYDMAYGKGPTPFMSWAAEQGAIAVRDGLGMLVEQAAESFCLWLGDYPETQPVMSALREHSQAAS